MKVFGLLWVTVLYDVSKSPCFIHLLWISCAPVLFAGGTFPRLAITAGEASQFFKHVFLSAWNVFVRPALEPLFAKYDIWALSKEVSIVCLFIFP